MGAYADKQFVGTKPTVQITITDSSGAAIDITNYTFFLTIKASLDTDATDAAAIVADKWTPTAGADATNGITSHQYDLTSATAGTYYWGIKYLDDAGAPGVVFQDQLILEQPTGNRVV